MPQTRVKSFLNLIKSIYKKPAADIILNDEKMNVSPQDHQHGKDVHSYLLFCIVLEVLASVKWQDKEIKDTQNKRGEIKLSYM